MKMHNAIQFSTKRYIDRYRFSCSLINRFPLFKIHVFVNFSLFSFDLIPSVLSKEAFIPKLKKGNVCLVGVRVYECVSGCFLCVAIFFGFLFLYTMYIYTFTDYCSREGKTASVLDTFSSLCSSLEFVLHDHAAGGR